MSPDFPKQIIPFNEYRGIPFRRLEDKRVLQFQSILHNHHFTAPMRVSKGSDIVAACGQLGGSINRERNTDVLIFMKLLIAITDNLHYNFI